jgi:DnaK suppressor protein
LRAKSVSGKAPARKSAPAHSTRLAPKVGKPIKSSKELKNAPTSKDGKGAKDAKSKALASKHPAAVPVRPGGRKGASPAIAGKRKTSVLQPAEVRPLGVLPPESMARGTGRPPAPAAARRGVVGARPQPAGPPTGAEKVTEKDFKEFERRLLEERAKILKEMGHLETTVLKVNQRDSAGDLSGYSFHMADVGTDAMEREKAFLFASSEGRTLMEINEALRRLYRGEYGVCESCGQPIARARLEAMPHARLCVVCKEKEERTQRGAV